MRSGPTRAPISFLPVDSDRRRSGAAYYLPLPLSLPGAEAVGAGLLLLPLLFSPFSSLAIASSSCCAATDDESQIKNTDRRREIIT
jgi:hypothetical protein